MVLQNVKDFVQEWRYQVFYLSFYAGYLPLILYLPVYLRHVGLTSVQVGIINGIRPILQSLVTPLLILVGEKLRSNKLLFVVSCVIAIGKVLIMFLLIRPQRQLCTITTLSYMNKSEIVVVSNVDKLVHVSLLVNNDEQGIQNAINNRIIEKDNRPMKPIMNLGKFLSENSSASDVRRNSTRQPREYSGRQPTVVSNMAVSPAQQSSQDKDWVKFDILYNSSELNRIFIALIFLTCFADPFVAAIYTLVDYSCAANTNMEKRYKEVRFWETIGWGTMTPIIGLVIYELRNEMCGTPVETFHYMFYFFIAFTIIALVIGLNIDFMQKVPDIISKKIHSSHSNLQYGMFSIISAFAGFGHGFLLTFVNWFIDTLGGSSVIMGIATATKAITDITLYFMLGEVLQKVGYVTIISVSLFGHIAVFIIYFAIKNAWMVILAEALYGIVYSSLMSTAASFLVSVAPAGSSTRMQGMF